MQHKTHLAALLLAASSLAHANNTLRLNPVEGGMGAMCVLAGKGDITWFDGEHLQIGTQKVALTLASTTRKSKTWKGNGVTATFTIPKGRILEQEHSFSVGKGPLGTLTVDYQGNKLTQKAWEQCFGAD